MSFDLDPYLRLETEHQLEKLDYMGDFMFVSCKIIAFCALMGTAGVILLITAFFLSEGSYGRTICIELAFGATFVVLVPLVLQNWTRIGVKMELAALAFGFAVAIVGAFTEGILRSIAVEIGVGVLILVCFEFWASRWLSHQQQRIQEISEGSREHSAKGPFG